MKDKIIDDALMCYRDLFKFSEKWRKNGIDTFSVVEAMCVFLSVCSMEFTHPRKVIEEIHKHLEISFEDVLKMKAIL